MNSPSDSTRRAGLFPCLMFFVAAVTSICPSLHAATDPFAEGVRPTPWRSPEEQQKTFRLPPGFEMQLVAAETNIHKPFNLAFDAKGRLWVTTSIEYPWAAPTNKPGRDRIMIFEDFAPDGHARKVTEFAGGLNIPIGIYPYFSPNPDGKSTWKTIAWSIPNIWLFEDTDGDGKADKRERLYGPFDHTRDTHGNQASFRRGFDGWLYCTHGYNNDSHVQGRDGNQVDLNSGNTYRIRLDGSRIEHHTHGQVNPYGLAFDEFGSLYSSDCHSEPIYQLLTGGYYPSFGKPHDGLGFAPTMMDKVRGSTAIDGISIYADNLWPEEFRGNIFIGDVMTSRVYRDRLTKHGSTRISHAMPDFVVTDDPWFRPVDTQLGPDGALYIADFYNRIIGHYEVPLTHPGRDRTSGRIWRVVYKGSDGKARLHKLRDFTRASARELVTALSESNIKVRSLASDQLVDRLGTAALPAVKRALAKPANNFQHAHVLWVLHRLDTLDEKALIAAAQHKDSFVRVHAMRILADTSKPAESLRQLALSGLDDPDALVQRCAAEALARHPNFENIHPLIALRQRVPKEDTHLLYVARKALRDQLTFDQHFKGLTSQILSAPDLEALADVAIAVKSPAAAAFLLKQLPTLSRQPNAQPSTADILRHAARYAPESELGNLTAYAQKRIPEGFGTELMFELGRQFALFKSVDEGLQQRGLGLPAPVREWGTNLVWRFFGSLDTYHSWVPSPLEENPTAVPWDSEKRKCADGKTRELTSSLPGGEQLTGLLRSETFALPERLTFWLCGHNGSPDKPDQKRNVVRLREAQSKAILIEVFPPRNDTAQRINWNLSAHQGKRGYVEVLDADTGTAYAWLAFGGFEPELSQLRPSEFQPGRMNEWLTAATEAAIRAQMKDMAPHFARFCVPTGRTLNSNPDLIGTFIKAWLALDPEEALKGISAALAAGIYSFPLDRERVAEVLSAQNSPVAQEAVVTALKASSFKSQEKLAYTMASAKFSAETLLASIENGVVSPRVLQRVGVNNRLKNSKPTDWEGRVAKLTKGLTPADETREKLMTERRSGYAMAPGKIADGQQVFTRNCAACHRIGTEGALIGPQLDGIGQRGLERLCEDILDPNRNVDRAFRSTLLVLKDGDVTSGLFRREEGELVVLAESTGKEITVPKSNISERRESEISLMPENFGELLSKEDFNNLMAYLLSQAAKQR